MQGIITSFISYRPITLFRCNINNSFLLLRFTQFSFLTQLETIEKSFYSKVQKFWNTQVSKETQFILYNIHPIITNITVENNYGLKS